MSDIYSALQACLGIGLELDAIHADGAWHRCRVQRGKSNRDGAYCLRELVLRSGTRTLVGVAHNWYTGDQLIFDVEKTAAALSDDEKREARAAYKAVQAEAEHARAQLEIATAARAAKIWHALPDTGACEYLQRKKVRAFGARFTRGLLVVPVRDVDGALHGLQFIAPDGGKKFLTGTPKKGRMHILGDITPYAPILICEGYATGASLHLATAHAVAVAFDAGNLLPVAEMLRGRYPFNPLLLCADDDAATPGNPGVTKATIAAAVMEARVYVPDFSALPDRTGLTDANDLHVAAGIDELARQINAAKTGSIPGRTPVSGEADNPPEIESPPLESYADDPAAQSGIKNAPKAAPDATDNKPKKPKKKIPIFNDWRDDLRRNQEGSILGWAYNIELILTHDDEFAGALEYCLMSYRILKNRKIIGQLKPGEWTDSDTSHLMCWLGKKYYFSPTDKAIAAGLVVVSQHNSKHPVRAYLTSLTWDGLPRLDNWLVDVFDARPKNENQADGYIYLRAAGRYFLIGAVARVMAAPVKMDNVLILEGLQGEGKSTAAEILFGEWFSDSPIPIGDKDAYQVIQGKWGVELGELDSFNKAESTSAKNFFSSKTDRYRPSYGHTAQDFPRQCVFIGSTNQQEYLKDYTGNRRYWPVYCMEVNLASLRAQRDQLWAEALHYYQQGAAGERGTDTRWWPDASQKMLFDAEQDARLQIDPWQSLIENYLHTILADYVTSADVLMLAVGKDRGHLTRADQGRIGPILQMLGWQHTKKRVLVDGCAKPLPRWVYAKPDSWQQKGVTSDPY